MWNDGDPRRELRGHEVAMGRSSSEVVVLDDRVVEAANRSQPGVTNINVTRSSRLHIGPKFVSVTQNVDNTEVVKDLPLPQYLWNLAKSTTTAERLSCAAAIAALLVCIILIVYFNITAKKNADSIVDVAPHEWFITRDMWLAPPFLYPNTSTEFAPLRLVIIAHTVSSECTVFMNCAAELRALQSYFATNYKYDIPYNFVIGNEGRVYEIRGWNRIGAHSLSYNFCSLGLGFIGDYREGSSRATDLQLLRAQMLFKEGVRLGYLHKDFLVVGAKDVIDSESPGTNLYNAIRKWHNYDHEKKYIGKTCQEIHGVQPTTAALKATPPPTFKNISAAPHEWFITREMWLAPPFINQNATTEFAPLKLVIIAHTVSSECNVFMNCAAELRALQSYFVNQYGYDIPYNFLIGNDDRVYEGRGWNRVGAHTVGYNPCSLSLAFIGDYREGSPSSSNVTELQLVRAQMLLAEGVKLGYLQSDYHVVGQKDVVITESPGANLYREIQKWKNYNTQYAGKSCEAIHGVDRTSVADQTGKQTQTFKNPISNPSLDT
ncbi:hypothetical protein PYW08_000444 [Mythimna loreyi]|uniref:Uncharacterized protein n=1 Tax=Mythimna loreyi TaxID=667449 RepID=A0ACC2RCG8_9NEOP|nr:hypothetical protein PYW08_000444 [Mythimna loreyi]